MSTLPALVRCVLVAMLVALAAPRGSAQTTTPAAAAAEPGTGLDSGLEQQVRQLALADAVQAPGGPRIDVSIGQLDPRLRLAPCQHVEPHLPEGMRLWGKSRIGLRCTQGLSLIHI